MESEKTMRRAADEMSVESARQALRESGLRSTASRVAVLQHLAAASKPLSHADVADVLVPTGYDKSTLYRCLVELADAGLLARLDAGDHSWRFELRRGGEHEGGEHPHFVCTDCGKVSCLPDVEVKISLPRQPRGAKLGEVSEIFLKGKCPECAQ